MAERDRLERHFAACASCHRELAQARRAEAALRAAPLALPEAGDLRDAFHRELQAQNLAHPPRRAANWRLAAPALAAAGLLGALWRPAVQIPTVREARRGAAQKEKLTPPADKSVALSRAAGTQKLSTEAPKRSVPALPTLSTARIADNTAGIPPPALKIAGTTGKAALPAPGISQQNAQKVAGGRPFAKTEAFALAYAATAPKDGANPDVSLRLEARYRSEEIEARSSTKNMASSAYGYSITPVMSNAIKGSAFYKTESEHYFAASSVRLKNTQELALDVDNRFTALNELADASGADATANKPTIQFDEALLSATFAPTAAPEAVRNIQVAAAMAADMDRAKAETAADDGVDFEVRDEERGFASRTRVTGQIETRQDGETLIIEAESEADNRP